MSPYFYENPFIYVFKREKKRIKSISKANKIKSEFLANMGRELRTSLTMIGFSEVLLNESSLDKSTQRGFTKKKMFYFSRGKSLLNINDIVEFLNLFPLFFESISSKDRLPSIIYSLNER
jgi:signal transduction histidine kinase